MYPATVMNIFIASPMDVQEERQIVKDRIHRWNVTHSAKRGIVLLPLAFETHTPSRFGTPPQDTIDKYVLDNADFLIAIFWSTVGSGATMGEILRHVESGKPASMFFSSKPIQRDHLTTAQEVVALQKKFQSQTYYHEFSDRQQFIDKLDHEINKFIDELGIDDLSVVENINGTRNLKLSKYSTEIIKVLSRTRRPLRVQNFPDNFQIDSGDEIIYNGNDPREYSIWKDSVNELQFYNMIEYLKMISHGEVYELSKKGWDAADALQEE